MYPNPYLFNATTKTGLLTRGLSSLKSINWSGLLDGTQKTLGVINQAIPVVYQIKPIVNNARTLFKIAGAIKSDDSVVNINDQEDQVPSPKEKLENNKNQPIFYI